MRLLHRLTISILTCGALALSLWTLPALGQGANPPASTKESGQTSGHGQTMAEQGQEKTITGCLSGPNAQGAYTLTNKQHKNGIEVSAAESLNLKGHVGHEVKLTGTWASGGAATGEKAGEKGMRQFQATNIEHVASSCTSTGSKTKGEKSKY